MHQIFERRPWNFQSSAILRTLTALQVQQKKIGQTAHLLDRAGDDAFPNCCSCFCGRSCSLQIFQTTCRVDQSNFSLQKYIVNICLTRDQDVALKDFPWLFQFFREPAAFEETRSSGLWSTSWSWWKAYSSSTSARVVITHKCFTAALMHNSLNFSFNDVGISSNSSRDKKVFIAWLLMNSSNSAKSTGHALSVLTFFKQLLPWNKKPEQFTPH